MAALIGLDWGTTHLRAALLAGDGRVLERRASGHGMRALPQGGFAAALAAITCGWPCCPQIACGMIGARGGWREVPYLTVPVDVGALAGALVEVTAADGAPLYVVPGVSNPARCEVMRGEETQALGTLVCEPALHPAATLILPGTHCKWVRIEAGRIVDLRTRMTGELYALLMQHSMLAVNSEAQADPGMPRFVDGVRAARDSGAAGGLSRLFAARAALVLGELLPDDIPGWVSGLLISEDIRSALADPGFRVTEPLRLIGEAELCMRYRRALAEFSLAVAEPDGNADAVMTGLWQIAVRAGLVAGSSNMKMSKDVDESIA